MDRGEIHFSILPDFWGNGYATEAVRHLIKFGFDELHLIKIEANSSTENIQSMRVLEKVGMIKESIQPKTLLIDDEWKDMVRKGYYPKESGDIMYILKPGYLPKSTDLDSRHKGTSHGSAYSYDTHVPLLWFGKRIPTAEDFTPLEITDITPTLAHLLNLQLPNAVTGTPIKRILCK